MAVETSPHLHKVGPHGFFRPSFPFFFLSRHNLPPPPSKPFRQTLSVADHQQSWPPYPWLAALSRASCAPHMSECLPRRVQHRWVPLPSRRRLVLPLRAGWQRDGWDIERKMEALRSVDGSLLYYSGRQPSLAVTNLLACLSLACCLSFCDLPIDVGPQRAARCRPKRWRGVGAY